MTRSSSLIALGAVLGGLFLAAPALAEPVYALSDLNLRTGPGEEYPILGVIKKHDEGDALGCLADWTWCDISVGGYHGWVAAEFLVTQKPHLLSSEGQTLPELQAASLIPVVEPVVVVQP